MKSFLDDNFLLHTQTAQALYHTYAKPLPIIDYHNHLSAEDIANDRQFENLTQVWLYGDHYKWRAMRAAGVPERYCTGDASDWEKFQKWAETVPYTLRNPLYHWTHLELQRYFGVHELLSPESAERIYARCSEKLRSPAYSVRGLLRMQGVEVLCTIDDPTDSLEHHKRLHEESFEIQVLPTFRPDKAMNGTDPKAFVAYVQKLEAADGAPIETYRNYLDALKRRHDHFSALGCVVSDHGLESMPAEDCTDAEAVAIFLKLRSGNNPTAEEATKLSSALLYQFCVWNHEKGWVQQFHLGALRNNNTRLLSALGPDTGWDSIGDFSLARSISKALNRLDSDNRLTKTILYNLNPADNEVFATMIGNFNDGSSAGKIQWGSGWWFLDQKDGMTKQLNALSNMGLLSRFVGMVTDSRSFLSYPRHEYFRRILCHLFGEEMERGELPNDLDWTGKIVQDICYGNAANYFGWNKTSKE